MDDHYITAGELALLVAIFVGPFLFGAAATQFFLLRQAGFRRGSAFGILSVAAVLTLVLAWGLMYVVPPVISGSYGGPLIVPGLIAAVAVTISVGVLSKWRRPAA